MTYNTLCLCSIHTNCSCYCVVCYLSSSSCWWLTDWWSLSLLIDFITKREQKKVRKIAEHRAKEEEGETQSNEAILLIMSLLLKTLPSEAAIENSIHQGAKQQHGWSPYNVNEG